ncbi:MAG: DUF4881 domain-containing protein [Desulfobulbaceae bacterium]|nr:DUF4881 domain-containing protein [Desulfobulbaceae bacterium]
MKYTQLLTPLVALALAMMMTGCSGDMFGQVEQGRVVSFDKEKNEIAVVHDSAMDQNNPLYDVVPAEVFKLPLVSNEMGPEPAVGQRLKVDADKKVIVIYDLVTQNLVEVPMIDPDLQKSIGNDHPLVFDADTGTAKSFPVIDKANKKLTIYSGRQKLLCTCSLPDEFFDETRYPPSTWIAGDDVRIYYKKDEQAAVSQALRLMNVSKTNIYRR